MDRNKKSKFVLAAAVVGLLTAGFIVDYLFFREQRQLVAASINAKRITAGIAEKISEMILSYESIATEAASTMNNTDMALLNLHDLLYDVVSYNDNVYGCIVAYMPDRRNCDTILSLKYCSMEDGKNSVFDTTSKDFIPAFNEIRDLVVKQPLLLDATTVQLDKGANACYFLPFRLRGENPDSSFSGILGLELSGDWFISFIESVSNVKNKDLFLLNYQGNFLYHPNNSIIMGKNIFKLAKKYNSPELEEVGHRMLKGESGLIRYKSPFSKESYLLYFTPVPHVKCYLGVLFPENTLIQ